MLRRLVASAAPLLLALAACQAPPTEEAAAATSDLRDGDLGATCGDFLKRRVYGRVGADLDGPLAAFDPRCSVGGRGAETGDCRGDRACHLNVACGALEQLGWGRLGCYQDDAERDWQHQGPTHGATRCAPTADCNFCCEMAPPTPGEAPIDAGIVFVVYDPLVSDGKGGQVPLHTKMGWFDPTYIVTNAVRTINEASGGALKYSVARTIVRQEFPVARDGFRYDEASYAEVWRTKRWRGGQFSYAAMMASLDMPRVMAETGASEVWMVGAPGFDFDEFAFKIPRDEVQYDVTNPWLYRPYDLPDLGKTYWVMGLSYERDVAEAVHSFGHRVESMMSLTVGRGAWDSKNGPPNLWNRFTRTPTDGGDSGCGNVHVPPNGAAGYDYGNTRAFTSTCEDWLAFPNLVGTTTAIDGSAWGRTQLGYLRYWLGHLPRRPGITEEFIGNWWQYIAAYDRAIAQVPPAGGSPRRAATARW